MNLLERHLGAQSTPLQRRLPLASLPDLLLLATPLSSQVILPCMRCGIGSFRFVGCMGKAELSYLKEICLSSLHGSATSTKKWIFVRVPLSTLSHSEGKDLGRLVLTSPVSFCLSDCLRGNCSNALHPFSASLP